MVDFIAAMAFWQLIGRTIKSQFFQQLPAIREVNVADRQPHFIQSSLCSKNGTEISEAGFCHKTKSFCCYWDINFWAFDQRGLN